MKLDSIIEKQLKRLGKPIVLCRNGQCSTVTAVTEAAWKRNQHHFEDNETRAGKYYQEYYHYIGPASYDVTTLQNNDYALMEGKKYRFIKSEGVYVGGNLLYYRAVIKKMEEADGNVFAG